jgi:hypothetical protein
VNAIGAWVEIRTEQGVQTREVVSGGGHVSGQAGWVHAGIGTSTKAEVRVRWPNSGWGEPVTLDANGFAILPRDGAPQPWTPPR